jgi:hypothetical protein
VLVWLRTTATAGDGGVRGCRAPARCRMARAAATGRDQLLGDDAGAAARPSSAAVCCAAGVGGLRRTRPPNDPVAEQLPRVPQDESPDRKRVSPPEGRPRRAAIGLSRRSNKRLAFGGESSSVGG